ncbi:hypothetical protein [Nocardiopsis lambiniae]|uniref:Uncharacterized protein n=1 Tax=Nocardiopsis lambiniae TaxID=3075539 RepID=A0ABU2MDQ7_9ACTN|nr:hypothetical protein [Nocardiopsis sp. DSM 44743]MDT0330813.1 hypothetical protein [Nocardiopsis sp. DSM 44743]
MDVPWAFEGHGSAWVESPLQFLSAVEAYAAHGLSTQGCILLRQDSAGLGDVHAALRGLFPATPPAALARRPTRPKTADFNWVIGDAFSGQVQRSLLRAPRCRLVLVDDGLAVRHLLRLLVSPTAQPVLRARVRRTPSRLALGAAAGHVLRRAVEEGRLTVFTMLPLPEDLLAAASTAGIRVMRHDFPLLRSLPRYDHPVEHRVVLGTALVNDGLVRAPEYLGWVDRQLAEGPVAYHPHRREDPRVLERLAADPRVRLVRDGLPVELSLRGLGPRHTVRSLPSTALVSLRLLVRGAGIGVDGVPEHWWTDLASPGLREELAVTTALVNDEEHTGGA